MNALKNMRIGKRLIISFIIIVIIASISGLTGLILLSISNSGYSYALTNYGFSQGDVGLLLNELTKSQSTVRDIIFLTNKDDINNAQTKLKEIEITTNDYLEKVKNTLTSPNEITNYDIITNQLQTYRTLRDDAIKLGLQNLNEQAISKFMTEAEPALNKAIKAAEDLMNINISEGNKLSDTLSKQAKMVTLVIIILIILSVIIAICLSILISRGISKPINNIIKVAESISQGNLDVDVNSDSNDEIGQLANTFKNTIQTLNIYINDITRQLKEIGNGNLTLTTNVNYKGNFKVIQTTIDTITKSLVDTISQIDKSSELVFLGSNQIATVGQTMSQGSMDQASSVEQLTATLNEISEQIRNNAQHSEAANIKASDVKKEAEVSNQKMKQMIEAMVNISEISQKIDSIMKDIEAIATQTNLLSLNAAIEAARAGEAGAGFAVVADEIGQLASQSAEAAKNTNVLVENTVRAVLNGTKIAEETAISLDIVVNGVKNVTENIENISIASATQSESIGQVTQAIEQISIVVQTNSATAEESAASSEELSSQSQMLKTMVSKFKIK